MYLSTIVWYAKEDKIEKIARIIEINIEEKNKLFCFDIILINFLYSESVLLLI